MTGPLRPRRRARGSLAGVLLAIGLAACSGPILANPTLAPNTPATPTPPPASGPDPQPVVLPRDDGPHARLTEWWYYTGHLRATDGRRFGIEAVVFRAERGTLPVTWASHLALTDEAGGRFLYAQRSQIGVTVDRSGVMSMPLGFALAITGAAAADPSAPEWFLLSTPDGDHVTAGVSAAEAKAAGGSFALDLGLRPTKPPVLHGEDGWIDFGAAGGSYYYSRTALAATGTLTLDGATLDVAGSAWFDHQWGDFISVGGGGWDWFAVNLADGTDLTLSLVRDAAGGYPLAHGTLVDAAGVATHLERDDFTVETTATWTSPRSGAVYPAGWRIFVPRSGLLIGLTPSVTDQELDTRATTGVVYWEGSQVVAATRGGIPIAGEAYVELTGYAPTRPASSPTPTAPTP